MDNIELIGQQLSALAGKVSSGDRKQAAVDLNVHPETVNRYLRGGIKKEAFGLVLLGFLKARVADREKALATG